MLPNSFILKLASCLAMVICLSHCTTLVDEPLAQPAQSSKKTVATTPFSMPAKAYLALAQNQTEEEKQNLLISAAGRFIYDGQWREGLQTLQQTNNLSLEQANQKKLLEAKVALIREQGRSAIAKLASVREISSLPSFYQVQYHEILASAYDSVGSPTESVVERMKLESLLQDDLSRSMNRRLLWLTLTKLPLAELNTLALESHEGSERQGWFKLALIARQKTTNTSIFTRVEQWQEQYPEHAANSLLPKPLDSVKPFLQQTPKQIALLLPLTGALAGPGGAIRDGFMAAAKDSPTTIRQYDTASGSIANLYQQALNDGAEYIVGPLSKTDVATVAALDHPVPTLLLNDMDTATSTNAFRFGLSPSNEAKQVAIKAGKKGFKRALIIAPAGAWGDEIVAAFSTQWRANGGVIADKLNYGANQDLNFAVRDVLHISDSQGREKQIKQLLGQNIQTITQRRQDFDMVFLLAYPSKARQIMPLLKYYFAGDAPVYATSSVYGGSPNMMKDRDLDGIIFCDMPWVFAHQMANKNWPEQLNSYNRLYALGMDSYSLSSELNQLLLFPAMGMNDKSGTLYLSRGQQVARVPAWGQFKGGVATAMTS